MQVLPTGAEPVRMTSQAPGRRVTGRVVGGYTEQVCHSMRQNIGSLVLRETSGPPIISPGGTYPTSHAVQLGYYRSSLSLSVLVVV